MNPSLVTLLTGHMLRHPTPDDADAVLAVIEQQFDLSGRPCQLCCREGLDALLKRGAGDRQRVDRVALAALARGLAPAGHQLWRDTNDALAARQQEPLELARLAADVRVLEALTRPRV